MQTLFIFDASDNCTDEVEEISEKDLQACDEPSEFSTSPCAMLGEIIENYAENELVALIGAVACGAVAYGYANVFVILLRHNLELLA
jgi:hypothetical protein